MPNTHCLTPHEILVLQNDASTCNHWCFHLHMTKNRKRNNCLLLNKKLPGLHFLQMVLLTITNWSWIVYRGFINVLSRRASDWCSQAGKALRTKLHVLLRIRMKPVNYPLDGQTSWVKSSPQPVEFARCPSFKWHMNNYMNEYIQSEKTHGVTSTILAHCSRYNSTITLASWKYSRQKFTTMINQHSTILLLDLS